MLAVCSPLVRLQELTDSWSDTWAAMILSCDNAASSLGSRVFRPSVTRKEGGHTRYKARTTRRCSCDAIAFGEPVVVVLIEGIDLGGGEFASWDLMGEENV